MTELNFHASSSDDYDDMPHLPDESSEYKSISHDGPDQEPEEPKMQWVYDPHADDELHKSSEYKMACFIMGCLIHEDVVTTHDHNDIGSSDMRVGINIIANCLKGNLLDSFTELPFDF